MKAAVMEQLKSPLVVRQVKDPDWDATGAIVKIEANGICRSDWHGWMGDLSWVDVNLELPWVLGHEFTGVVEEVGKDVKNFKKGDRVIVPFSQGDGTCEQCLSGHHNICDNLEMPGFSYWGGFAEYTSIPNADLNMVHLPDSVGFEEGASVGCRFMTSFHAVTHQAKVKAGEWVAVYGVGGVGLAATHIANAAGANVISVDISDEKLALAKSVGAAITINSRKTTPWEAIHEITKGGAHVSIDALGIAETITNSVLSLRKRGRHVQIGLTTSEEKGIVPLPTDLITMKELQFIGSFGMQAPHYPSMLEMIAQEKLNPGKMVTRHVSIDEVSDVINGMGTYNTVGVTVLNKW
ncbi:zinc-dependent alcohol dehydrogenase family protein [Thalassobacillus sp. C254]|uniref:zinc-dependent alcohol dehydrogenase family protein n=1 Tax=Thalassobacillus sp. C254 TaxID=1225341 RepID=UPI0006CFBE80|nr:zinc-dependent alcohol dehydrogenase family protein [Thalassobacillus sp. C254]